MKTTDCLFLAGCLLLGSSEMVAQTCAARKVNAQVHYRGKSQAVIPVNGLPTSVQQGFTAGAALWSAGCNQGNIPGFVVDPQTAPPQSGSYNPEQVVEIRFIDKEPNFDPQKGTWAPALYGDSATTSCGTTASLASWRSWRRRTAPSIHKPWTMCVGHGPPRTTGSPGAAAPDSRLRVEDRAVARQPQSQSLPGPALELRAPVEVPVVVLAETLRGGPRDAPVHRVLKAIGSVPETLERHGRTAGRLLGESGSTATVDALVVAQAVEAGGAQVLAGDEDDLRRLAQNHPEVWVSPSVSGLSFSEGTAGNDCVPHDSPHDKLTQASLEKTEHDVRTPFIALNAQNTACE